MGNSTPPEPQDSFILDSGATPPDPAARSSASDQDALLTFIAGSEIPVTSVPAAVPPAFGRYTVQRALGAGSFGTVYLGHDAQLDRPVAIKVLRSGPNVPREEADRLMQEARKLARLHHPGIVTVHDVGTQDGQVFIVSNYLDGQNLADRLKQNPPNWPEAARIAACVAEALAHAHAHFTIHRDVKPANIIMTSAGQPVLVDFGLALDDSSAGGRELGIVSGTPSYMAPEQVAGAAHRIDGRTDVYSLGVVLYQMLCGRVPFRASTTRELLRQVRDDEPQPLRQVVLNLPPELERICFKALAKKIQDRYGTASDFAEDLRRAIQAASDSTGSSFVRHSIVLEPDAPASSSMSTGSVPSGATVSGLSSAAHSLANAPPLASSRSSSIQSSANFSSSRRRIREAERRQVTVLICGTDLFESEAYLENLEAEDQAKVLGAFQQACTAAVRPFDGTVVQCNEQGLLACFGFPVAYEDSARRAARAGLNLLTAMDELGKDFQHKHQLELSPWVGLHTGPALVEEKEDAFSLVGEARNVALKLAESAEPGQLICTEATHRLIWFRFQCASLGRRKIKGVPEPVELFEVQGLSLNRTSLDAAGPTGLTPLTGRDHETALLQDRWDQAKEGMGQVVLLPGEAGVGKSRLVYTLEQYVESQSAEGESPAGSVAAAEAEATPGATVIKWRCSPHFQNTGLYPAIEFFKQALALRPDEAPSAQLDRLIDYLRQHDLARPDTVPLFASLLSLPADERFPPLGLSPVREREEMFQALADWLSAAASRQPVLFVIEDLHWVDASTKEFLTKFLAEGLHERILALLTFRPEFQPPWPSVGSQHTTLTLNRLNRRQVAEFMAKKLKSAAPEKLVDQIYDRTGGVPLFVEEFTKMVQESGALKGTKAGGTPIAALPAHEIPSTLQDLIMARLDRLEGDREIAQLAATIGREFSYELLAAVVTLDEPTLQAELTKLVQAEILFQKGRLPKCSYAFKHALLEDALYNSLVKSKRQQFHQRIAEVLEARFAQTVQTQPELLAHHFTEAGMTAKAIVYWLTAGLRSRQRSAEIEAIGHLTKGRALLETLAPSTERDAQELELLGPLGVAYVAVRGYAAPEVEPVFRRARELCERVGQPLQLFAIMLGIWEWHTVRGDLRLCADLAVEGIDFAQSQNDPGIMMEALFMRGETMLHRGDFAGARESFADAVEHYDDRERTKAWAVHTSHDAGITHRSNLAVALWHQGYPDQAIRANREMCELARQIGHPYSLAYAMHHTAWLFQLCRIGSEVRSAAHEGTAIATAQGFALWRATGAFFAGGGLLLEGKVPDAIPLLLGGVAAFEAGGAELTLSFQFGTLGEAYLQLGRFAEAHAALDRGLAIVEKNDERCHEPELLRLKGELLLSESAESASSVAAEEYFQRAIETARQQQSRAWEFRTTMSLARLWKRQGRSEEARRALAAVFESYQEGFATPDLVEAAALLKAMSLLNRCQQ
ncbi:MAG TPA: protein kinase [Planctomycetaceae bacterium]|jgi:serine/threonine protein kinase/tetratricopeptide (TPR) repeat protein|nr:protein kinase [Planctomycetaceae bacterium]